MAHANFFKIAKKIVGHHLVLTALAGLSLPAAAAEAVSSINGQINVSLVITASCEVSKGTHSASVNPDGGTALLDFGSHGPTWSERLNAQISDGDKAALMVLCNPSVRGFRVTINGGAHGDGNTRHMSNGRQTIPYQLSADASGSNTYGIGQQRYFAVVKGTQTPIPVFGTVPSNTRALMAGAYTDTLTVALDW